MTDYNDGNWHGWNGGERPVHPLTLIELRTTQGVHVEDIKAGMTAWDSPPFLFRVTKQHKEPREFWIGGGCFFDSINDANYHGVKDLIHVREVTQDDS